LLIGSMNPDEEIEVKALRNGEEKDFTVKLKLRPQELFAATQRPAPGEGGGAMSALAGVELHDLTPQLRSQLDVPENIQGPVVTNIRMNTPAYKGGLRQGDIIQQVGQTEVSNTSELRNALSKVNKDTVLFLAWNSGGSRFVVIKLNNE
ncbi:MAG: PDZ domain-containing protein, partial [Verrucomicrobia bacterium]|nr:PDZ domain-containing protein [Verrucomicrobiota bacterium]